MTFICKAYSNIEMANHYGISYKAWLDWLKAFRKKNEDIGKPIRGLWQPAQVQRFVDHMGLPSREIKDLE